MQVREAELRRDIAQLERQLQDTDKRAQVEQLTRHLPPLDEATLDAIYQDLVSSPPSELSIPPPSPKVSLAQLAAELGLPPIPADASADTPAVADARRTQRAQLLACLSDRSNIPAPAWTALAIQSARDCDTEHVQQALSLAARDGVPVAPLFQKVMDVYASAGHVHAVLELSAAMEAHGIAPSAASKHTVVKAYVQMNQVSDAVQYLALWERSEPAPMSAYTLTIEHVLKHPVRDIHPIAWSLFYHMRYAAHPVPDAVLYAMMIRACAAGVPQPNTMPLRRKRTMEADAERALDLFREMTVHHGVRPNKEVYDSLILTCARRKDHYADALRLLHELVEGDHTRLWPDAYTYNAVLQGSARHGDLTTARWILADMVRSVMADAHRLRRPNEDTLAHVFWTYAVYQPPIDRHQLSSIEATQSSDAEGHVAEAAPSPTFTHALPQTSSEVLAEVRALMARILADQGHDETAAHPLSSVRVSPRLLHAYLAVLTHHLPPERRLHALVHEVEHGVFAQSHVQANGHTLAMLLGECAVSRDRALADDVARRTWAQWTDMERAYAHTPQRRHQGIDAKLVSRMWALMIRHHAKSFRIDEGLELVRRFLEMYPPSKRISRREELVDASLPPIDWTPTVPPPSMVRLLHALPPSRAEADATYAPLAPLRPKLLFRDLELLHHRCVAVQHAPGLNLITRTDREYRREW